ncbi:MAG: hypothetical protein P1U57_12810 [Oleibacter sp.]|nr:hypothetical protein [Thalassolituus sp.]
MVRLAIIISMSLTLLACATVNNNGTDGVNGTSNKATDYSQFPLGTDHPAVISLFQQADKAGEEGNWNAAITYLDQARRVEPRNPYVFYRQAWASAQAGDKQRASQLLERARVYTNKDDELLNYRIYKLESELAL